MSTVILWIVAAVGLALAVLALRAYLLEKREGLPRSSQRLAASGVIALALVGLAVYQSIPAKAPVAPPAPKELDAATKAKVADLEKQIAELNKQLAAKADELDKLDPSRTQAPPATATAPASWPILAGVALLLFGFGALLLGDLDTLLPKRRKETAAPTPEPGSPEALAADEAPTLAGLTAHAQGGRYDVGLALGRRISIEQLSKLEVLDALYLRGFCAVMSVADAKTELASADKAARLTSAREDLARLLELAPHMAEARWLLGYTKARAEEWDAALADLRAARADLPADAAPFDVNESVCLLATAEQRLAAADNDGATARFDEVTKIGVLAGQIPVAMVTHRILVVREHIKGGKFDEAADGIARIRAVEKLDEAAQRATTAACDVYDVAIQYRSGQLERALAATQQFFTRWQPAQLPPVDDQVADEFLLPAIDKTELPLPADLYRGLYYLSAVVQLEVASRRGAALAPETVEAIATALLRALQFQPRERTALAALAALYLAYRKERSDKAVAWLDAALTMGVRSGKARAILGDARRVEQERKELLSMFRAAAARFLADPAVGAQVRRALIEELGRFDEFRPVVLDLQATGALEAPHVQLTVPALRERAAFVSGIAAEVVRRADPAALGSLEAVHRELAALAANVDTSATRIAALERSVMEQLGRIVLR
ncbi:MAG TPA: hypothetical protein VGM88_00755 [Kofleriaceae bacterium]